MACAFFPVATEGTASSTSFLLLICTVIDFNSFEKKKLNGQNISDSDVAAPLTLVPISKQVPVHCGQCRTLLMVAACFLPFVNVAWSNR